MQKILFILFLILIKKQYLFAQEISNIDYTEQENRYIFISYDLQNCNNEKTDIDVKFILANKQEIIPKNLIGDLKDVTCGNSRKIICDVKSDIANFKGQYQVILTSKKNNSEIFTIVEEQAEFPGGLAELVKFIQKNLQFPALAREAGISGKVFLKFIINETGEISDIEIIKGIPNCEDCNREALRVVKSMPKWKSAKMNERNVKCYYTMPISFKIQ